MNTGTASRALVTLLACAFAISLPLLGNPAGFHFESHLVDRYTLIVEPPPDSPLPPGLQPGDRIDLREQDLRTRAALYLTTLPGESYVLHVQRNGTTVAVPVTKSAPEEQDIGTLHYTTMFLVLVLGLSTLWWGRNWAAWGLSLSAIGTLVNFVLLLVPLPAVAAFIVLQLNQVVVAPLLPVGLYVSALALCGPVIGGRLRTSFHLAFSLVLLTTVVLLVTQAVGQLLFGDAGIWRSGVAGLLYALSLCVPLVMLVIALPRADSARRLRLRWILFSLVLFVGAVVWNNLAGLSETLTTHGFVRQIAWWTAMLCGLGGLLYAVLRKRVVGMSFAINRALVYGLVVALVLGTFGALTVVLENTAIGREAGFAVTVGVSLAIGFVLEALRDRINVVVERVFFRRRYAAEAALRRFAQECAFIENSERLLDETQAEIRRHVRPAAFAIYDTAEGTYLCLRRHGDFAYPERIDIDDRAFVSMRARREPVALRDVASELGEDGYAFPMAARGVLEGALVCGPRSEEYTPDERRLVAEIAQQVGIAMHALRARHNEALLRAIAGGELDASTARQRARAALSTP